MNTMDTRKRSRDLSFKKQLLFSLIICTSLLSAAEVAIRVWAYYFVQITNGTTQPPADWNWFQIFDTWPRTGTSS